MLLYELMPDYRRKEGSLLREHLLNETFFQFDSSDTLPAYPKKAPFFPALVTTYTMAKQTMTIKIHSFSFK